MLDKPMTIDEFTIECEAYHQYIVRVARRYDGEPWEIDNQICECVLYGPLQIKILTWFDDWNEGQPDVFVLAYADIQTFFQGVGVEK